MKKYLFLLLLISLLTHFIFFSYPSETVFDEVHFGKFISGYLTGKYFFDIHPPLGKLLIAGVAKITDFKPDFSFKKIGQKFPDNSYIWLRFLPRLAGALLPIIIFLIALQLGIKIKYSFLTGLFVALENALIVQSRFILIDSFLLLFGFTSLLFFIKYRQTSTSYKKLFLFLSGFFAALAFSVKWTGLSFLGLILIFYLFKTLKSDKKIKTALNGLVFLIIIPAIIYFSFFALHFSLLYKSGPGDAFHSPNFQKTLLGNKYENDPQIKPSNLFSKFIELNKEMYESNKRLSATHPYSSKWYYWPFMKKAVYYWHKEINSNTSAYIYLLGNIFIWWLSTFAIAYLIIITIIKMLFKHPISFKYKFLITGYLFNLIPFIFIGRVMFLYHYLTALIFAIIIIGLLMDKYNLNNETTAILAVVSLLAFLFFSPLTYGLQLPQWYPDWYINFAVWLSGW